MASKEFSKEMEYNFVSDLPEKHMCQICMKLLNEPQLTDCCGQHFCRTCLDRWFQRQGKKQCPHCRRENITHILNKRQERKTNELKVYCSNREKGCGLTLRLEELKRHLSTDNPNGCGYVEIECPNKCGWLVPRKKMADHCKNKCPERKARCKYCNEVGQYLYITMWNGHVRQCQEYPVDCPNKCGAKGLKRKDLDKHGEVCPLEPVECPFYEAGCKERMARKDLDNHIESKSKQHLLNLMMAHAKLTEEHIKLKKNQKELLVLKSTVASVAFQLEDIQERVEDRTVAKSIEMIKTKLNEIFKVTEEGDQLVFQIPCDSWDWVSPIFTVCDTKMYLKINPPQRGRDEEYFGSLTLILVSGDLDGQYEIHVEETCEEYLTSLKYSKYYRVTQYDPIIKLCTKCSNSPAPNTTSTQGRVIGRVSLPDEFEGGQYKLCKITVTLKEHHCR